MKKKNARFDSDLIYFWSWELINGLEFIHSNYVIHRDIKPHNIFLQKRGHIKIGDFGSARTFDQNNTSDTLRGLTQRVGTYKYMSPELQKYKLIDENNNLYSFNTDNWSAGCVLYELIQLELLWDKDWEITTELSKIEKLKGSIKYKISNLKTTNLLKNILESYN